MIVLLIEFLIYKEDVNLVRNKLSSMNNIFKVKDFWIRCCWQSFSTLNKNLIFTCTCTCTVKFFFAQLNSCQIYTQSLSCYINKKIVYRELMWEFFCKNLKYDQFCIRIVSSVNLSEFRSGGTDQWFDLTTGLCTRL